MKTLKSQRVVVSANQRFFKFPNFTYLLASSENTTVKVVLKRTGTVAIICLLCLSSQQRGMQVVRVYPNLGFLDVAQI